MATLTRSEMEQVLLNGGSVLHGGVLISRVEQLPGAIDLAKGDPEAETAAANAIQQQIAELQAQVDRLTAPAAPDPAAEKTAKKKAADSGEG